MSFTKFFMIIVALLSEVVARILAAVLQSQDYEEHETTILSLYKKKTVTIADQAYANCNNNRKTDHIFAGND